MNKHICSGRQWVDVVGLENSHNNGKPDCTRLSCETKDCWWHFITFTFNVVIKIICINCWLYFTRHLIIMTRQACCGTLSLKTDSDLKCKGLDSKWLQPHKHFSDLFLPAQQSPSDSTWHTIRPIMNPENAFFFFFFFWGPNKWDGKLILVPGRPSWTFCHVPVVSYPDADVQLAAALSLSWCIIGPLVCVAETLSNPPPCLYVQTQSISDMWLCLGIKKTYS